MISWQVAGHSVGSAGSVTVRVSVQVPAPASATVTEPVVLEPTITQAPAGVPERPH